MLLMAVHLFFNCELMAENSIGINTYLGKWVLVRDPSKPKYIIKNIDGHIVIDSLVKGQVVSNIKHNSHSLSFLRTSEVNPQTGKPYSVNVKLLPDVRSNANMFKLISFKSEEGEVIDYVSLMKNGNNQIKRKTGISNEQSKHALENIYTRQWDFPKLLCTDGKVPLQIVAMKNNVQAIFKYRGNKAQVPAKIVDNTVTISIDPNKYGDLKNIPIFRNGSKYNLQLIPIYGNKDDLIIKACLKDGKRTICSYFMASSMEKKKGQEKVSAPRN